MKVYVLTCGEYSDYKILGVFSTPEKAMAASSFFEYSGGDHPDAEDWELDEFDEFPAGKLPFYVEFERGDSSATRVLQWHPKRIPLSATVIRGWHHKGGTLGVTCWAEDEDDAVKIASELRSQFVAAGCWDTDEPDVEGWGERV